MPLCTQLMGFWKTLPSKNQQPQPHLGVLEGREWALRFRERLNLTSSQPVLRDLGSQIGTGLAEGDGNLTWASPRGPRSFCGL